MEPDNDDLVILTGGVGSKKLKRKWKNRLVIIIFGILQDGLRRGGSEEYDVAGRSATSTLVGNVLSAVV